MNLVVAHFKELTLKGQNRPWFVQILVRNIKRALVDLDVRKVRSVMGRLEIELGDDAPWDEVKRRLSRVFGLAKIGRAHV